MSAGTATRRAGAPVAHRPAVRVGAHVLVAALLGVFADIGLDAPGSLGLLTALATPWLLLAFSAARGARPALGGGPRSVPVGSLVVVTGLVAYYVWLIIGPGVSVSTVVHQYRAPLWLVAGVAVGGVFGIVAALSLSPRPAVSALSWSTVAAVPLADALLPVRLSGRPDVAPVVALLVLVSLLVLARAYRATGVRLVALLAATLVLTLTLWQAERLVLLVVFHRHGASS
jgi:hypothetical protein